uniref:Odorant receptor n=1 Tax=Glossina brevipalpis TaxID=37001 RepID=A0A1A9WXT5_9MUSC
MIPQFLRDDYPLEKHLFLIPKFALRLIGFYPESKLNTPLCCWAFFNFAILGYGSYGEFVYGVHYLGIDMQTALDALCPMLSSIMSLIKISFIWWYRKEYKHIIEEVRRLTEAQSSMKKMRIKRKFFTIATRLNALVLLLGTFTGTAYTVRLIINNMMLYLNQESIIYETPFKMMFPQPLLAMPLYPLTCALSHWHGYITVAAFAGADGFFLGFCFYFATLLKALQEDLIDTLAINASLPAKNAQATHSEADVISDLIDIIKRHNEISQLMQEFSSVMVGITLSHFITSSLIIGTSIIELLLSEELTLKAYCSQWYGYSVRLQKMILLIIIRSQRTITVKIPFITPALPTLTAVCIVAVNPVISNVGERANFQNFL